MTYMHIPSTVSYTAATEASHCSDKREINHLSTVFVNFTAGNMVVENKQSTDQNT